MRWSVGVGASRASVRYLGAGGASSEAEARGVRGRETGVEVEAEAEAARLRTSGSEPGRRSVRVSAVSSKSSPNEDAAEEDDSACGGRLQIHAREANAPVGYKVRRAWRLLAGLYFALGV